MFEFYDKGWPDERKQDIERLLKEEINLLRQIVKLLTPVPETFNAPGPATMTKPRS
jgi:hypothetical protein